MRGMNIRTFYLVSHSRFMRLVPYLSPPYLLVDQPAGTGFSYIDHNDNARELAVIADQGKIQLLSAVIPFLCVSFLDHCRLTLLFVTVVAFMSNLYQIFPELQSMDLFLAGESYAGTFYVLLPCALESC